MEERKIQKSMINAGRFAKSNGRSIPLQTVKWVDITKCLHFAIIRQICQHFHRIRHDK